MSTNNKNCTNIEDCNYCYSCDSCNYCNSCYSCYSCNYCNSCNSCDSCDSCNYCNSCNYCDSCDSCNYCNSCNYCDSCDSCDSCNYCNSCNYCDSCDYSANLRMSERMLFCLGDGKYESKGAGYQKNNCIFNVQVTPDEWDKAKASLPTIEIGITKWVDKSDMTKAEKDANSVWKETGGYLKRYGYQEAWKIWWDDAAKKDKQAILDLPHFDKDIFKGITGIDVDVKPKDNKPQVITIDGVEYKRVK